MMLDDLMMLMTRARSIVVFVLLAAALGVAAPRAVLCAAPAQQVVDRIAARIEDDIITTSQMRELAAYQQLVDGQAQPDADLLSELIQQWVVNNEATSAIFPPAAQSEVDREVARVENQFSTPQAYKDRLAQLGITAATVRQMVAEQIFLARYLDYKFRTTAQVTDAQVEDYYQKQLLPDLAAKKQPAPSLDQVRDQIRELLTQRAINDQAAAWVGQSKSRLNVEIEPGSGLPSASARHE